MALAFVRIFRELSIKTPIRPQTKSGQKLAVQKVVKQEFSLIHVVIVCRMTPFGITLYIPGPLNAEIINDPSRQRDWLLKAPNIAFALLSEIELNTETKYEYLCESADLRIIGSNVNNIIVVLTTL